MARSRSILHIMAVAAWFFGSPAVHADNAAQQSQQPQTAPVPDSSWQGRGVYDLKAAGIRIHVSAQQRILLLHDNPLAPYRRCHLLVQAIVHDEKLGLMLIGRGESGRPVINDWDAISAQIFSGMPAWYRQRPAGQGWVRFPVENADFYGQPTYDPNTHRARWVFSFTHGGIGWFSSHWLTFDRDGYVVVTLLSGGDAVDALDALFTHWEQPPIQVDNLTTHPAPLPAPGSAEDYTAGFLATMAEPMIGACEFETPFGDNY